MILPGFRLGALLGWFSGVFFFQMPWGTPNFTWLGLATLMAVAHVPIFVFFNADTLYHYFHLPPVPTSQRVDELVLQWTVTQQMLSNILIRLIFLWKARRIVDLLGRFKLYQESRPKIQYVLPSNKTFMDITATFFVFSTTFGIAYVDWKDAYNQKMGGMWLQPLVGDVAHATIFVTLFIFPINIPLQCAFSLIVATISYLVMIFEDYCLHVQNTLMKKKRMGMSIILPLALTTDKAGYNIKNIMSKPQEKPQIFFTNHLRQEMLARFEIVREIFALASEIIGPMALVILAGSSIGALLKVYQLAVIKRDSESDAWHDDFRAGCHLFNFLCYFWILQCGQRIHDAMSKWKENFEEMLIQLSEESHQMERQAMKDITRLMQQWNWKFTASNFFVIDRTLASGVVSIILTHTVVLVQLKISDSPESVRKYS